MTGAKGSTLHLCACSHLIVMDPERCREILSNVLALDQVIIPLKSIFFSHSFSQHAVSEWTKKNDLRYHIYYIPRQNASKDQMVCTYVRSFCYRLVLSQRVTAPGSEHLSTSGRKSMYSNNICGNDDMVVDIGSNISRDLQQETSWSWILTHLSKWYNNCDFLHWHNYLSESQVVQLSKDRMTRWQV